MAQAGTTTPEPQEAALLVEGMNCASCVAHVEKAANRVPGVQSSSVNLARGRAVIRFDPEATSPRAVAEAISKSGYPATPESEIAPEDAHHHHHDDETDAWFWRAVVGAILWLPVEATHWILQLSSAAPHHAGVNW